MRAREAGIFGGGITVGVVVVLASFVTVGQALAIEDQQGSPLDVAPLVVGTTPAAAPLAVPPSTQDEPTQHAEPEAVTVEAVTAPEPRSAVPAPPPTGFAPPAQPPAAEVPPPAPPTEPERPSKADLKRWIENRSIDEALAWAKAHGWTEEHIRAALREYAHHFEGRR